VKKLVADLFKKGQLIFDKNRCVGCEACVEICPSNAVKKTISMDRMELAIDYGKCIYCGFCFENCPEKAIKIKSTKAPSKARYDKETIRFKIHRCKTCGRVLTAENTIYKIKKGKYVSLTDDEKEYLQYCNSCKRKSILLKRGDTISVGSLFIS